MSNRHSTRRAFLKRIGGAAAAGALAGTVHGRRSAKAADVPAELPVPASRPTTPSIPESAKSIVAHVRYDEVIEGRKVHEKLLREMIEDGIRIATVASSAGEAWNALLRPDDVVGIKFNQVGAEGLETTTPFARELVASLKDAGVSPERIVLIEAPPQLERELGTRARVFGWGNEEVSFGSGAERLASVLDQVTAIVNVPFLKTHNIAGMTGCLKNLSHALIRRPGRYHDHACTPYIGDIVALPQIRSKVRIHIVNALRAVYDGGPVPRAADVWGHGGVIVSKDPVAADSVGLDIINERRQLAGLGSVGDGLNGLPYIRAAAERKLGTDDQDYIELVQPALE